MEARWNGRPILACRDEVWNHRLATALRPIGRWRDVAVGDFTPDERNAFLRSRRVEPAQLSTETAAAELHPRTAFHAIRLAGDLPDARRITREQVLLADFRNRELVKGPGPLSADPFQALVRDLAETAREAVLRYSMMSLSKGEVGRRAAEVSVAAQAELLRVLGGFLSGSWWRREDADPTPIAFGDAYL